MLKTEWTRDEVLAFRHMLHWIPAARGWTTKWMEENAPGWTTTELAQALRDSGALVLSGEHFSGYAVPEFSALTVAA